jgi:NAD(P)-dependent dehydrogenase (short-subunit alcohol dehydrogenase family)
MKSILIRIKKPRQAVLELGQYGITVNAVIAGLIDTLLTRPRDRHAQAADAFKSGTSMAELEAETEEKLIAKSPAWHYLDRA